MKQLVSRARCLETVHPSKVHLVHFLSHSSLFQPFAYSALRLLFLCSDTGDTGILASCCESSRLDSPNCCCETSHCRPSAAAVLQSVQLVEIRVRVNHCGAGNVQVNATTHTSQSGSLILTTLSTILPPCRTGFPPCRIGLPPSQTVPSVSSCSGSADTSTGPKW